MKKKSASHFCFVQSKICLCHLYTVHSLAQHLYTVGSVYTEASGAWNEEEKGKGRNWGKLAYFSTMESKEITKNPIDFVIRLDK